MSPQPSNRDALIEGTLRCLERLPVERVTARAIATEANANLASIAYHFGSKDELLTEAAIRGLDRWLERIDGLVSAAPAVSPARIAAAASAIETTRADHEAVSRGFVQVLARAQHDERLRELLAQGFRRTRPALAAVLGLGEDPAGSDAAGLVLSLFHGLLIQTLIDPALAIDGERLQRALARLAPALAPDA